MEEKTYAKMLISAFLLIFASLFIAINNSNDILSVLKFGFSTIIIGIILHILFKKQLSTFIKS